MTTGAGGGRGAGGRRGGMATGGRVWCPSVVHGCPRSV
ncbi:MAG: hypothetical protein AVDCRST_MAG54-2155 [uncultured Actinomycetospora sp.]|uniref:Uncharacterized protein n=1 Tax=uncultured Actinomycetospora sp. TaxID=1135996 RepID=A0A6J4IMJ6_9PSEU|nr:MAG: hypothetical protein AVDCRST_MAG54-2155 [uncultured Actinomycetospora sp.]